MSTQICVGSTTQETKTPNRERRRPAGRVSEADAIIQHNAGFAGIAGGTPALPVHEAWS